MKKFFVLLCVLISCKPSDKYEDLKKQYSYKIISQKKYHPTEWYDGVKSLALIFHKREVIESVSYYLDNTLRSISNINLGRPNISFFPNGNVKQVIQANRETGDITRTEYYINGTPFRVIKYDIKHRSLGIPKLSMNDFSNITDITVYNENGEKQYIYKTKENLYYSENKYGDVRPFYGTINLKCPDDLSRICYSGQFYAGKKQGIEFDITGASNTLYKDRTNFIGITNVSITNVWNNGILQSHRQTAIREPSTPTILEFKRYGKNGARFASEYIEPTDGSNDWLKVTASCYTNMIDVQEVWDTTNTPYKIYFENEKQFYDKKAKDLYTAYQKNPSQNPCEKVN